MSCMSLASMLAVGSVSYVLLGTEFDYLNHENDVIQFSGSQKKLQL